MEPAIPAGATEAPPSSRRPTPGAFVAAPILAAALGGVTILIAGQGAQERPAAAAAVLAAGAAAAFLPFRYGLPIAIVLAAFEGFLHDFAGPRALYWNEAFTAGVAIRSCLVRRPSRRELTIAASVVAVFGLYVATGTSLKADLWGMKVLLTSVVVGWAVARVGIGWREWRVIYLALATVAGASLVLGIWQRTKGVSGLFELGLGYGPRIREVAGGGTVRIFGGATSAAPLSYMLAITICAWVALMVTGGLQRRLALSTAWLPPVGVVGIFLAVDRTAVIGLSVALVVLALALRRNVLLRTMGVTVMVAAITLLVVGSSGGQLGDTAHARVALWREYVRDLRVFGAGPATSGSAYDKVGPKDWRPPLVVPNDWDVRYDRVVLDRQSQTLVGTRVRPRPRLRISAQAQSLDRIRRLVGTLGYSLDPPGRVVLATTVPKGRPVPITVPVPGGPALLVPLWLTARPTITRPVYPGYLVNLVENPSFERATTGWYALEYFARGARITRDPDEGRFGPSSLSVVPTAPKQGAYTFLSMAPGTYTATAWVRPDARTTIVARLTDNVISAPTTTTIVQAGAWAMVRVSGRIERRSNVFYLWATDRTPFRIDAVQVEAGPSESAYCDGRAPHCRWSGKPDASPSFRAAKTTLTGPLSRTATSVRVASTGRPMPRATPFGIVVDGEQVDVRQIINASSYRVSRGAGARSHAAGAAAWAVFATPARESITGASAVTLTDLRVLGVPPPRTPAERIWQRWFDDTPAALEGDGPGLVDNLYVSWIFQYGVLGVVLGAGWIVVLLWPWFQRRKGPATTAASLVGIFLIVSAVAVSVWEESPTDILAALVFAAAVSEQRTAGKRRQPSGLTTSRAPAGSPRK